MVFERTNLPCPRRKRKRSPMTTAPISSENKSEVQRQYKDAAKTIKQRLQSNWCGQPVNGKPTFPLTTEAV